MVSETGVWTLDEAKTMHGDSEKLAHKLSSFFPRGIPVIDAGCGIGNYARILEEQGFVVTGIEGTPGIKKIAVCSTIHEQDLTLPLNYPPSSVLCLEVGEHIPPKHEQQFLENLNNMCDRRLILSWAIPGQGGHHHVNEKTNEYIIKRMEGFGLYLNHGDTATLREDIEDDYWWFKHSLMVFDRGPKIGLAMIVKDEAKTIERSVSSALPYIDCAVINHSGTTDDTVEIGTGVFSDIPNEWIEPEWKGAADAYNHCINRLRELGCHWIIRLDADQVIGGELPTFENFCDVEGISIPVVDADGSFTCSRPFVFRPSASYRGVRHEGVWCNGVWADDSLTIVHHDDSGARPRTLDTYLSDFEAMKDEYRIENDESLIRRYTFYMAQSLRDGGKREEAVLWYRARTLMGGYNEEIAIAYKEIAYILNTREAWITALRSADHRPDVAFGALKFALSESPENQRLMLDQIDCSKWKRRLMFQDDSFHWKALEMVGIINYRIGEHTEAFKIWKGLTTWTEIPPLDMERIESCIQMI